MRNVLAVASVAGLLGASGFVAWSALSRPDDVASRSAGAFDLQDAPASPSRPAASEELRDAVAAPASPRPIAAAGMQYATPMPAPRETVKPFLTPALEAYVRDSKLLRALQHAPARALLSGSAMRSPAALKAFLGDKAAVNSYLDSTLVRVALNSPAVAKLLIGNPALVRAFLGSPAMRDPQAVKALLASRMLVKMLDCPGVQEALADPAVIRSIAGDPGTVEWLARNPHALDAVAAAAPSLASSLAAAR